MNADALVGGPGELLSHNMFAYCKNNPVMFVDSSGFKTTIYVHSGENVYGHVSINVNGGVYTKANRRVR